MAHAVSPLAVHRGGRERQHGTAHMTASSLVFSRTIITIGTTATPATCRRSDQAQVPLL